MEKILAHIKKYDTEYLFTLPVSVISCQLFIYSLNCYNMWNIVLIGLAVGTVTMAGYVLVLLALASKQSKENKYWSYRIKE